MFATLNRFRRQIAVLTVHWPCWLVCWSRCLLLLLIRKADYDGYVRCVCG